MKILVVHDFYSSISPSGENGVVLAEIKLLKSRGHKVELFARANDGLRVMGTRGLILGGLSTPWNPWAASALQEKVRDFRPDVVHVHNTFPLLSSAVFHAIGKSAARVLTLHNFRLFCPNAIPLRDGGICTECLDRRSVWPSLKYGCYRGSRIGTVPLALSVALHRLIGTWKNQVEVFIALTEFQRRKMIQAGLPGEKVHLKANFFPGNPRPMPWAKRNSGAVFVGRLSQEKGLETLTRAWALWGKDAPELRVVGSGPLRKKLEQAAKGLPIRFLGQLSLKETHRQIAGAKILILPSEWFEAFPMVLAESFAFGTPAAVSDIGGLSTIIQDGKNGLVFKPGDSDSLAGVLRKGWNKPGLLERLGEGARKSFEESYTMEANYRQLIAIYEKAVGAGRAQENG